MRPLIHIATVVVLCLAVPSCAMIKKAIPKWPRKKDKDKKEAPDTAAHVIGAVEMVNPEQHFVLIRTQAGVALPAGTELTAMDSAGAISKLKLAPEKKGDFLTADIVSGNPRAGTVVFYRLYNAGQPNLPPNMPGNAPAQVPAQNPSAPPVMPLQPLPQQQTQPPPLTPVSPTEFLKPGSNLPVPPPPQSSSPIPQQPRSSGSTVPAPGQIDLPPVIR